MSPQTNTRLNVSHTPSMFELGGLLVDIGGAFDGPWSPDEPDDLGALMLNEHLDPEGHRALANALEEKIRDIFERQH